MPPTILMLPTTRPLVGSIEMEGPALPPVRRCVGAAFAQFEMRLIIRAILERVVLRPANRTAERPRIRNITIAPQHGCRVVVERRLEADASEPLEPVAASSSRAQSP